MVEKTIESKYSLQSPSFRCGGCEGEVGPGDQYFSAVLFLEESFLRNEYCPTCWGGETVDLEAAFAFWRTTRPKLESTARRRRFDLDILWEFFLRLQDDVYGGSSNEAVDTGEKPESVGEGDDIDAGTGDRSGDLAVAGQPPQEKVRLLFLIALLLVRGKRLVFQRSAIRDGREWLRLAEKKNPEALHLVENPELGLEDLERVKDGLGKLLQMEI